MHSALDDFTESARKLEVLEDMPPIDLAMEDGAASVGENLEVDDDEPAADLPSNKMDVDEDDEVDPLEAFMSGVKEEVQKVNAEDVHKGRGGGLSKINDLMDVEAEGDVSELPQKDELDTTDLNPEDIMAYVPSF